MVDIRWNQDTGDENGCPGKVSVPCMATASQYERPRQCIKADHEFGSTSDHIESATETAHQDDSIINLESISQGHATKATKNNKWIDDAAMGNG